MTGKSIPTLLILISTLSFFCSGKDDPSSLDSILPKGNDSVSTAGLVDDMQNDIYNSRQNAITRAVESVSPAVVGINVTQIQRYVQRSPFWDDWLFNWIPQREYERKVQGLGSGFLISPEGYILTNEHVVHNAAEIVITTTDNKQYKAQVVGLDETYDVALLKIEGNDFHYISLGSSDDVLIGEWVIALGNPFGLFDVNSKPIVTVGVVSAVDMDFTQSYESRLYTDMIQTDASINGGNSGGPLVNSLGHCIGINTFIFTESNYSKGSIGLGFAIPINRVKKILPSLKNIGKVDRSFRTGLEIENIGLLEARTLGISRYDGVIVSRVSPNSPADKAGIRVGDVVVAINDTRVRSTADVQTILRRLDITDKLEMNLIIFRDGKLQESRMKLEPIVEEQ